MATKFEDVFPCAGTLSIYRFRPGSNPPEKMSLMQTMHLDGAEDPFQLGAHLVAAYLNARSGKNAMPDVAAIMAIAYSVDGGNGYSPAAGVTWSLEQIVTYLKSTMPF